MHCKTRASQLQRIVLGKKWQKPSATMGKIENKAGSYALGQTNKIKRRRAFTPALTYTH
jgi:hypothetical protein